MKALALGLMLVTGCTNTVARRGSTTANEWLERHPSAEHIEQGDRVVEVHHGLGALEGAGIGLLVGGLFGVGHGYSAPLGPYESSSDCTIVCNHSDAAEIEGLMFGTLGLLVGAAVGALIGQRDVLDLR